ncbi:scan domain-containing protein 3 [Plakobranchus ocellatus]|uniref:Scan domain-containing protein 3 n=1 Tax=Plakobranchus ocellatus TaxID=259542 RepID=A0AAV4CCD8_9GAST|nr:scan domain-containing protein 3 [Plakobranchus ocellatus]
MDEFTECTPGWTRFWLLRVISTVQALDYDEVKRALMMRYDLTDGYRRRFRICELEKGDSAEMFIVKIKNYLNRWVKLPETK